MAIKYHLPSFLTDVQTRDSYIKWLQRKAEAHIKRDRKRGDVTETVSSYKQVIHEAVLDSQGLDAYTKEELDWSLISKYNNNESRKHTRAYKKRFALLPSLDHVGDGLGAANFKICSWRTNDCKNDLSLDELLVFCKRIIEANTDDA